MIAGCGNYCRGEPMCSPAMLGLQTLSPVIGFRIRVLVCSVLGRGVTGCPRPQKKILKPLNLNLSFKKYPLSTYHPARHNDISVINNRRLSWRNGADGGV